MKKIFLSVCFLMILAYVFAQHPIGNDSFQLQTVGDAQTFIKSKAAIGSDSGFVNAKYTDTSAANKGHLKNYPGALIRVGNDLWMRNTTATEWIKMNGTGGGTSGIGAVYAGNCLTQVDDSTLAFDPACAGVDSIYIHSSTTSDTVLYDKNGSSYIAGWIDRFDTSTLRGVYMDTVFLVNDTTLRACKGTTCWNVRIGSNSITFAGDTVVINNVNINKSLLIPRTDTVHARQRNGSIIYDTIANHYYGYINGDWFCLDCDGGLRKVYAGYGLSNVNDSTLKVDTSLISTKANVDSKTITINAGTNVTIAQAATQNLGAPPSWTINATTSGGSTNSNIGTGYRWAIPNTNNIKTVFGAYAITIDSTTNANALTFAVDTTASGIHTEAYFNTKYVRISDTSAMLLPYLRKIDTTGKWVTDVTKNATFDSIYVWKNGTHTAFRDSISSGSGSFWKEPTGANLSGINIINSPRPNGLLWNGAYTETATGQYYTQYNPTITTRSTNGDTSYGMVIHPIFLNQGTSGQQYNVALDIDAVLGTTAGASRDQRAIQFRGDIMPKTTNVYSIGSVGGNTMATVVSGIMYSDFYRSLATNTNLTFGSSTLSTMRLFTANSAAGGLQLATHGNLSTTSNNYMFESFGAAKITGGMTIPALVTPLKPTSITAVGGGTTHMVYKWVARLANGATTDAGPADSTIVAAATLTGTNKVTVTLSTEVIGAAFYDLYLVSTTGAATTGKIGTFTATNNPTITLTHTSNSQGDGTTAPTSNKTGNLGVGTTTPQGVADFTSTTQGIVLPRMTKAQRDAIVSPVAGMAVYQTDNTPGLRVYNGTNWMRYTETAD